MNIRNATLEDAHVICDIYNYYIENTAISFETEPILESEMRRRMYEIINSNCYSFYVGEIDGKIIGYCYTHPWNNRRAYASTQEVSIYLDPMATGKGFGTMLFNYLLTLIDKNRIHVLIAGICIPNESSIRLHEKFGFKQISNFKEVGRKFGQWHDVGHWQLIFNSSIKNF